MPAQLRNDRPAPGLTSGMSGLSSVAVADVRTIIRQSRRVARTCQPRVHSTGARAGGTAHLCAESALWAAFPAASRTAAVVVLSRDSGPLEEGDRDSRAPGVLRGLRGGGAGPGVQTLRIREHRRHDAIADDGHHGGRVVERADHARVPRVADPPAVRGPALPQVRARAGRLLEQPVSVRGSSLSAPLLRRHRLSEPIQ